MVVTRFKPSLLAAALAAVFLFLAVYIHLETIRHPYIGAVLERDETGWRVTRVDPSGIAGHGPMLPDDRIISIDGAPAAIKYKGQTQTSLTQATAATFLNSKGLAYELRFKASAADIGKSLFALLLEVLLLSIAWLAWRANPGSSTVRKFALLNYVMALVILAVYSTEMAAANWILALSSVWLPYLLLTFCISFVLRAVPKTWANALLAFRVLSLLLSLCALWAVAQPEIPGWIRGTLHVVLLVVLLFLLATVAFYWRSLDGVEKNHALVLAAGLLVSLLPFLVLYAFPSFWGGGYVAPEYALTGLVPLSVLFLYVLNKRSMVDMQVYLPRAILHTVYYGGVFGLFALAYRVKQPAYVIALFLCFAAGSWVYRHLLQKSKNNTESRKKWLEHQTYKFSVQAAEKQNIQDILQMMGDMAHYAADIEGIFIVWREAPGMRPVFYGTGKYEGLLNGGAFSVEDNRIMDQSYWEQRFDFEHVVAFAGPAERSGDGWNSSDWKSSGRKDNAGKDNAEIHAENHAEGHAEDNDGKDDNGEGFLYVGPKRNRSLFSAEEKQLIEAVCGESVRLLANVKHMAGIYKQSQQFKDQNAAYERHMTGIRETQHLLLEAQQEERIRLSYRLHDSLLQNLIFLSRDLEELGDQQKVDAKRLAVWLRCLYTSQQEIRQLCDELYPHIVDKTGLEESLRWLLRTVEEQSGLSVSLDYQWNADTPPDPMLKSNLFRILRELVRNVQKHAEASRLELHLAQCPTGEVRCEVRDDGVGFDAAALTKQDSFMHGHHLGLLSVTSQIEFLGGELDIRSAPGKGTVITLRLPPHQNAQEGKRYG